MATAKKEEIVMDEAYWEELVDFMPPYDRLHREDIFLCVNGEKILISPKLVHESKQPVKIKRKFVQAFRDAEEQAMAADDFIEANQYVEKK